MRLRLQHDGPVNYQVARHNSQWADHLTRANVTAGLIASLGINSAFDPACGDGSILLAANRLRPIAKVRLTDISVPNIAELTLPDGWTAEAIDIETALRHPTSSNWDVIVLTEILEHVEKPEEILRLARERSRYVIASSPEMRPQQLDDNPEHLWQFDGDGYHQLLVEAGWRPISKTHLGFQNVYDFGIWVAE